LVVITDPLVFLVVTFAANTGVIIIKLVAGSFVIIVEIGGLGAHAAIVIIEIIAAMPAGVVVIKVELVAQVVVVERAIL
jgi:hypothetical protein